VRGPESQVVLNHGADAARAALAKLIAPDLAEPPLVPELDDWLSLPRGANRRAELHRAGQ